MAAPTAKTATAKSLGLKGTGLRVGPRASHPTAVATVTNHPGTID